MQQYKIKFYTEAGGAQRDDEEFAENQDEVRKIIYDDIIQESYLAFYYGLYIDIYCNNNIILKIDTKGEGVSKFPPSPIKIEAIFNGKTYTNSESFIEALKAENEDEDIENMLFEVLMDDPAKIVTKDNLTYAKLFFETDKFKFALEYHITCFWWQRHGR